MLSDAAEEHGLLLQVALVALRVEGGVIDILDARHTAARTRVLLHLRLLVDALEVRRFADQPC